MPILEKATSRRRKRLSDLLAVGLLLALLVGGVWLWWHHKHSAKPPTQKQILPASSSPQSQPARPTAEAKPAQPDLAEPVVIPHKPAAVPIQDVAKTASRNAFPRPVRDVLEAQIAMSRRAVSPGSIDGAIGSQTRAAIAVFQRSVNLPETGSLDTNTRLALTLDAPLAMDYVVTTNDLARLQPLGKTWLAKSQQTALEFETELELVAEKAHAHPLLIQKMNPGMNWTNLVAGTVLKIPDVNYPPVTNKAEFIVIHLAPKFLEAFDAETNLLLHCPCSIAAKVEKRPVGSLKVVVVAPDPNYTFDPAVFPESPEAQTIKGKLILAPGPNNPVGVAWIGLDRPGYGMHGTPVPEQVGRTESHGCFRLANWDAAYLLKLVSIGTPVEVVP